MFFWSQRVISQPCSGDISSASTLSRSLSLGPLYAASSSSICISRGRQRQSQSLSSQSWTHITLCASRHTCATRFLAATADASRPSYTSVRRLFARHVLGDWLISLSFSERRTRPVEQRLKDADR